MESAVAVLQLIVLSMVISAYRVYVDKIMSAIDRLYLLLSQEVNVLSLLKTMDNARMENAFWTPAARSLDALTTSTEKHVKQMALVVAVVIAIVLEMPAATMSAVKQAATVKIQLQKRVPTEKNVLLPLRTMENVGMENAYWTPAVESQDALEIRMEKHAETTVSVDVLLLLIVPKILAATMYAMQMINATELLLLFRNRTATEHSALFLHRTMELANREFATWITAVKSPVALVILMERNAQATVSVDVLLLMIVRKILARIIHATQMVSATELLLLFRRRTAMEPIAR